MRALSGTFSGTEVARRHVAGLHVVESLHSPDQQIPWHSHEWPYVTFVLRGAYTEQCSRRAFDIGEGDVVLHGAGESHANRIHATSSHLLNLEFTQPFVDRVTAFGGRLDARMTATGGHLLQLGARLHRELWCEDLPAHFREVVTLPQIAESAEVHPVHLARGFRRRQGMTVGEYIRTLRI